MPLTPYENMELGGSMPLDVLRVLVSSERFYNLAGTSNATRCLELCRTGTVRGLCAEALEAIKELKLDAMIMREAEMRKEFVTTELQAALSTFMTHTERVEERLHRAMHLIDMLQQGLHGLGRRGEQWPQSINDGLRRSRMILEDPGLEHERRQR